MWSCCDQLDWVVNSRWVSHGLGRSCDLSRKLCFRFGIRLYLFLITWRRFRDLLFSLLLC